MAAARWSEVDEPSGIVASSFTHTCAHSHQLSASWLVEVDPPDKFYPPRTRATEATWRNFVYADSERIFLEDVGLEVEWCGDLL